MARKKSTKRSQFQIALLVLLGLALTVLVYSLLQQQSLTTESQAARFRLKCNQHCGGARLCMPGLECFRIGHYGYCRNPMNFFDENCKPKPSYYPRPPTNTPGPSPTYVQPTGPRPPTRTPTPRRFY